MSNTAPTPLRLRDNNIWPFRLDEGGWVLVDAGLDYLDDCVSSWEVLVEQARAIGCGPEDVRAVVVTHEHIDHAGLAARWAGQGAAIIAMPEALPMLAAGHRAYEAIRVRRIEEMRRHGCPADILAAIEAALLAHRTHTLGWTGCPPEALVDARDGDTFALADGRMLHLIAAPGHTPGNLVAFVADSAGSAGGEWWKRADTGDLCSGDTLLPTTVPTPGLQFPGLAEDPPDADAPRWPSLPPFLRAVERLRTLNIRRILPGHGEIVNDPQRLFTQFTEHHARRSQRVLTHLDRSGAAGATAYEVVRGLFPRLPAVRVGQALTEIIGHLDVLAAPQADAQSARAVQTTDADGLVRTRVAAVRDR